QAPDTETRAPPVPRPDIPGELAFEAIDPRAAGDPAAAQRGGDLGDFLFGVVGTREREEWVAHGFRGAVFLLPPGSFSRCSALRCSLRIQQITWVLRNGIALTTL